MLRALDPEVLPDVRRVHLREVDELRGGGAHLPVARPDDPLRLGVPHLREGDPQVDPRDPPVLPVDGANKEHHRLAERGERRERNRFEDPQEEANDSFLHDREPPSSRSRIIREISSHPCKVLHLHAKRADGKRNVVGETDQVLLRRDRGQAAGLPGDPLEVPPAVRVMVRKREESLDPESGRRQGVAELRVPGQPGEREHGVPGRGFLRRDARPAPRSRRATGAKRPWGDRKERGRTARSAPRIPRRDIW